MSNAILEISNLHKKYRKLTAVHDLSFAIAPGEFVGFIGPNGAGKSTTMNSIAGTITPDSGAITLADVDAVADPVGARAKLGFVPQHLHLYNYLTGEEYLRFVGDIRQIPAAAQTEQIDHLLALCELDEARHRIVNEYSGGMARKLAICAALLGHPPLLLLDESFVGLDPESTHRIQTELALHCERGGAILLSSHVLDMLQRVCSRIVMLVAGELALDRPIEQVTGNLTDLYLETAGKGAIDQTASRTE